MLTLICLLLFIIFVFVLNYYLGTYNYETISEPFPCGSDEICHCEEARDCKQADRGAS